MAAAAYEVWLNDPFGNHLANISNFSALTLTRSANDLGSLSISVPDLDYRLCREDGQIEVWRRVGDGPLRLVTETVWLIRLIQRYRSGGQYYIDLGGPSLVDLLSCRIVPFASTSAYAQKSDQADDLMKAIVREQMGTLVADSTRSIATYLAVQADQSRAPSVSKEFSNRLVLPALQEIAQISAANDVPLYFDIAWLAQNTYEFRTYPYQRGLDHTASGANALVLSEERGNLADPSISENYRQEVTYAYAGTLYGTASDTRRMRASPFNRREAYTDASGYTTQEGMAYEAQRVLHEGRPRILFEGRIVDNEDTRYGLEWDWGDCLSAEAFDQQFAARVDVLTLSVQNGMETIDARARSTT